MIDSTIVNTVIRRLADVYQPEAIFLFGSYAWGEPANAKDIDILIVVKDSSEKPYKRTLKGFKSLRGLKIPKDILIYTEEEFELFSKDVSSLPFKVKNEGIKVYEAA
ncbi:nucleotidyltransferase domain-containing protein [Acidobacteriota bacterium]